MAHEIAHANGSEVLRALMTLIFAASAIFLFGFVLWGFSTGWRLTISDTCFCVESLVGRRIVRFGDVRSVELQQKADKNGMRRTVIVIEISGRRRPLRLSGFGPDNIELYHALHRAWLATREPTAAPTPAEKEKQLTMLRTSDGAEDASSIMPVFNTGLLWFELPLLAGTVVLALALALWARRVAATRQLYVIFASSIIFLAICDLYLLWVMPLRYSLGKAELTMVYLFRRRVVPYSMIANVELGKGLDSGRVGELVRIELKGGEVLTMKLRDGTQSFFRALHMVWQSRSGDPL